MVCVVVRKSHLRARGRTTGSQIVALVEKRHIGFVCDTMVRVASTTETEALVVVLITHAAIGTVIALGIAALEAARARWLRREEALSKEES